MCYVVCKLAGLMQPLCSTGVEMQVTAMTHGDILV